MQGGESVDVGGVDVGAALGEPLHLLLVGGGAGGQEDAAVRELDTLLVAGTTPSLRRLPARVTLAPALELLRPLEKGRRRAGLQRIGHFGAMKGSLL